MDRDYDGRLSFGEFMGEETPLEKVLLVKILGFLEKNICEDDLEAVGDADVVPGVQEHGQGWKWYNYQGRIPKDLQEPLQGTGCFELLNKK